MAKWGNSLGGWRKQKRARNGQFGNGGPNGKKHSSRSKKLRQSKKASQLQYKAEVRALKAKKARGPAQQAHRQNSIVDARVAHIDRKEAARKEHDSAKGRTGLSSKKKTALKVAAGVAVVGGAYGAYRMKEARLDSKATAVFYHNIPASAGVKIAKGQDHLMGSSYRDMDSVHLNSPKTLASKSAHGAKVEAAWNAKLKLDPVLSGHTKRLAEIEAESLSDIRNLTSGVAAGTANPKDILKMSFNNTGKEKAALNSIIASHRSEFEKANPWADDPGSPVFMSNKHRGAARRVYGSGNWMKKQAKNPGQKAGSLTDRALAGRVMTLKIRYHGDIGDVQFDNYHYNNPMNTLVTNAQSQVKNVNRRKTTHRMNGTNNPNVSSKEYKWSRENFYFINENNLKKNSKISIASVGTGVIPSLAPELRPAAAIFGVYGGVVAAAVHNNRKEEERRSRDRAKKASGKNTAKSSKNTTKKTARAAPATLSRIQSNTAGRRVG